MVDRTSPPARSVRTRRSRPGRERVWLLVLRSHLWIVGRARPERGQSTVEYALVLLGAAAVALALVAWVTRSDAVSRLFDSVVGRILERA